MKYKIVFFDADGTLINSSKMVPDSAIEAIVELRHRGILPVLATARTPFNIQWLLDKLPFDTYMTYNGGLIMHEGKVLHQEVIADSLTRDIVASAERKHHSVALEGARQFSIVSEDIPGIKDVYMPRWDHAKRVPYVDFKEPVSQIDLFCRDEEIEEYTRSYPECTFYPWVSKPNAFNIVPKNVSKAYGIQLVLEKLDIPNDQAVAFGDGPNDVEMLSYVGMGVAMGNAVDVLKEIATYITKDVDEDGIAHGLHYLGLI